MKNIAICYDEERAMFDNFSNTANSLINNAGMFIKPKSELHAGIELEFTVVDKKMNLAPQNIRDAVVKAYPQQMSVELGAHQLEILSNPAVNIYGNGLDVLERQMSDCTEEALHVLRTHDAGIVRIGAFPTSLVNNVEYTKGYKKYCICPQWHLDRQRSAQEDIGKCAWETISDPMVVSLLNAVQISIDGTSFEDVIDKLNRSVMISPFATTLAANARFLNLEDTEYHDVRFEVWRKSHDTRTAEEISSGKFTRVGMPSNYYIDIKDYFNRISSHPFVLSGGQFTEHAFEISNGLYWKDARLKFFHEKNVVAVEFRPIAVQPTLEEDFALIGFYVGRLLWSQQYNEKLLPINMVHNNKMEAMLHGMKAGLFFNDNAGRVVFANAKDVLAIEVDRAMDGLRALDISNETIARYEEILCKKIISGDPAEMFYNTLIKKISGTDLALMDFSKRRELFIETMDTLNLVRF